MKNNKKRLLRIILGFTAVMLTCVYPSLYIYLQSWDEVNLYSIYLPFVVYFLSAIIILIFSIPFFMKFEKMVVFTCVSMIFLMNFVLIQNLIVGIIPFFTYKGLFIVILFILAFITLLLRRMKEDAIIWIKIICIVWLGLILLNVFGTIPSFLKGSKKIKNVKVEQYANISDYKGNVYFFIFDEYGGQENLLYYSKFDNSDIKNYLIKENFAWSDNSYNTESISTEDIIPNILNLDYVTDVGGSLEKNREYTKNPVIYSFFNKMGYEINIVNHKGFLETSDYNVLPNNTYRSKKEKKGTIYKRVFEQGFISIIFNMLKNNDTANKDLSETSKDLDEVLECVKELPKKKYNKPAFNIIYIQSPHAPFVYNENGEYIEYNNMENYSDLSIYIGQLKYINTQIKEIVNIIKKYDSDSIVVMQSDHGLRYAYHQMKDYKKKDYDSKKETRMMQNVLNCVYLGDGEKIDIEGENCINTWRKVLNKKFGTSYDMLEDPNDYELKWKYVNFVR